MKKLILALALCFSLGAMAQSCILKRDSSGAIARSSSAVAAFKKANHCPSTGKGIGACPGYIVDHIQPLCACGPDAPSNMQWQTVVDSKAKDKLEDKQCAALKKSGAVR